MKKNKRLTVNRLAVGNLKTRKKQYTLMIIGILLTFPLSKPKNIPIIWICFLFRGREYVIPLTMMTVCQNCYPKKKEMLKR